MAHNILQSTKSEQGFKLLKLIQSYLELDMYMSLTVHTEDTLAAGRKLEEMKLYEHLLHVSFQ